MRMGVAQQEGGDGVLGGGVGTLGGGEAAVDILSGGGSGWLREKGGAPRLSGGEEVCEELGAGRR